MNNAKGATTTKNSIVKLLIIIIKKSNVATFMSPKVRDLVYLGFYSPVANETLVAIKMIK